MRSADRALARRLAPFSERGLIPRLPTRAQVIQGEMTMGLYVISAEATTETRYDGAPFGHPILRQPLILSVVGPDNLRIGTGMGCQLRSVIRHLHFTYHSGMPVWDLQLIQTYPDGLAKLRRATEALRAGETAQARAQRRTLALILPRQDEYLDEFLGDDGWIARAERFAYPTPEDAGALLPAEFYSLVGFMNHCVESFPARFADIPWHALPGHFARLLFRRVREGRGMGWFERPLIPRAG